MSQEPVLKIETAPEGYALLTLNRPDAMNALSARLREALVDAIERLEADPQVRVLILTGAGRAFCAGLDLKELGAGAGGSAALAVEVRDPVRALARFGGPVIGAINGPAITGGFELALNCDFLVASERARFADTHARVGILPGWGLTVLLCQSVGVRRARELSATGNFLSAEQALAWGLVNHVVPHEDLLPFTRRLAAAIVDNDREAVGEMMRLYDAVSATTPDEGWELEARVNFDWISRRYDPDGVAARRDAIVTRGRAQSQG